MLLQLLLELYNPLVVTRANRAAKQAPSADRRELMAAARRGLLQAAAKFDASRVAGSSSSKRLGMLADGYIRNALRDLLQEVRLTW
jgi:DNA-directed RNA polymerase specialized sigma subunit